MADTDLIWVASTVPTEDDGGNKVVLSETHKLHPNEDHQAWIAGPKPVQVARTAGVERVLREGTAREVDAPQKDSAKPAPPPARPAGTTAGA